LKGGKKFQEEWEVSLTFQFTLYGGGGLWGGKRGGANFRGPGAKKRELQEKKEWERTQKGRFTVSIMAKISGK